MKTIPLNSGKLVVVEDSDFERLSSFIWYQYNDGHVYRCVKEPVGILTNSGNARTKHISIANEIFRTCGKKYDHRDLNPLNNLRNNIRLATRSQNGINRPKFSGKSSKYKGVSLYKKTGRWYSQIMLNGKTISLGYYDDEIQAAIAYDNKALEIFGEFARPNFPLVMY